MDQAPVNTNITAQLVSGISRDEMAVIYSAAILADDDVTITADKLTTILKAANLSNVEPIWPTLYARALGSGCDVRRLLTSVGAVGTSGPQQQQLSGGVGGKQSENEASAADVKKAAEPEAADDDDDDDDLNLDLFG
jgi:large subunit ribosomal protein LP1